MDRPDLDLWDGQHKINNGVNSALAVILAICVTGLCLDVIHFFLHLD